MFHTQGIVLKRNPYREFDEILTIYTKDFGKIEAIGRGIKKPAAKLANHLQVFDFSEIEFVLGKNFKVLTGASSNKNLFGAAAVNFFDLLDSLTAVDDPDENIWNLILRFVDFQGGAQDHLLNYYFQFQLLSFAGFSPNILSFSAKLPSIETFLKSLAKSDEKAIVGLKMSQEEQNDAESALNYFKDIAFGYLR